MLEGIFSSIAFDDDVGLSMREGGPADFDNDGRVFRPTSFVD